MRGLCLLIVAKNRTSQAWRGDDFCDFGSILSYFPPKTKIEVCSALSVMSAKILSLISPCQGERLDCAAANIGLLKGGSVVDATG